MKQVNWGIIGLGNIALKFADAFKNVKNAKLVGVSSKDNNKLEYFKKNFQINEDHCFHKYEDLLKCDNIDIIYIALPNFLHCEWMIKCTENGKNVLVEKPATMNSSEMKNVKVFFNKKDLFFAEALMYLYHPQILKTINLIKEDVIGKLVSIESLFGEDILTKKNIFGFKKRKKIDKDNRLYNKELGGGAILDLGCYPLSFSVLVAKLTPSFNYKNIKVLKKKLNIIETGVDIDSYAEIDFGNSFKSYIGASFTKNLGKATKIRGTTGELVIEDTWHGDTSLIRIVGQNSDKIEINCYNNIYSHEIEILSKCLLENKKKPDFPGLTINDTLENMKILDNWLN